MSAPPGLLETTAQRPTACIIDARLALAPGGILLALRLSRFVPVWLTRCFWDIIDNTVFFTSYPDALSSEKSDRIDADSLVNTLTLWHSAWFNGSLNNAFFWIGDARRESSLPVSLNGETIARYDSLRRSLDPSADLDHCEPVELLKGCGRDAFSLAAALSADPPIILTVVKKGRGERPLICREAETIAEIHDPPKRRPSAKWADWIMPTEVRPVASQLRALGIRIAAVHTFAPAAITLPFVPPPDEQADPERLEHTILPEPWAGAHIFWHEVP